MHPGGRQRCHAVRGVRQRDREEGVCVRVTEWSDGWMDP